MPSLGSLQEKQILDLQERGEQMQTQKGWWVFQKFQKVFQNKFRNNIVYNWPKPAFHM